MAIRKVSSEIQKVTEKLAAHFAELEAVNGERPILCVKVERYHGYLKSGELRNVEWDEVLCKEDGKRYRVNGQHTSNAYLPYFANGGKPHKDNCAVVTMWECDTLIELAKLHARFDAKEQMRTGKDLNSVAAGAVPELAGVCPTHLNAAVSGLSYWKEKGDNAWRLQPSERANFIYDNHGFINWYAQLVSHRDSNDKAYYTTFSRLHKQQVVAAMCATYEACPEAAMRFWQDVRDERGDVGTHVRELAKWLRATEKMQANRYQPHHYMIVCIRFWNRYRNGEPVVIADTNERKKRKGKKVFIPAAI